MKLSVAYGYLAFTYRDLVCTKHSSVFYRSATIFAKFGHVNLLLSQLKVQKYTLYQMNNTKNALQRVGMRFLFGWERRCAHRQNEINTFKDTKSIEPAEQTQTNIWFNLHKWESPMAGVEAMLADFPSKHRKLTNAVVSLNARLNFFAIHSISKLKIIPCYS